MIAYTQETGPKIWPSVHYINVRLPLRKLSNDGTY